MRNYLPGLIRRFHLPLLDLGEPGDTVLLCGMGRSGTTWAADLINYDNNYRIMFEPFLPKKVPAARNFHYIQYVPPREEDSELAADAREILSGKVRNSWIDQNRKRLVYRRRIVKDIRCNLMLPWLSKVGGSLPTILIIRHPLQVTASWQKLNWNKQAFGNKGDLDIILSQKKLLDDFPIIGEVAKEIDREKYLERIVLLWCILYKVPLEQLDQKKSLIVFYENLLRNPEKEIKRVFEYLGRPFDWEALSKMVYQASTTNFNKRDLKSDRSKMIAGWKDRFSESDIQSAAKILSRFGMDGMYGDDGLPVE